MQAHTPTLEQDTVAERAENAVIAEPSAMQAEPQPVRESPGAADPALALAVVELELALDTAQANRNGFSEAVRDATRSIGGDFLFALPAAGLAQDCQKVAAVRLPASGDAPSGLAFVLLSEDGTRLSVRTPDERTSGLARFAGAFIEVLERF
jgi:hypothetical protein